MTEPQNEGGQCTVCPRCHGEPLWFRVRSDLMDIEVCEPCGLAAMDLGLEVTRLSERAAESSTVRCSPRGRTAL